jgi:hypothetical protein
MNITRLLTAVSICAVAVVVAATPAKAVSPVKGGVECHMQVKKSFRLEPVLRRGLPIQATCDGPARVLSILDFPVQTPQAHDLMMMFPGGLPGITSGRGGYTTVAEAGTVTYRQHLMPYAAKIARRYRKTKLTVLFLVEREDGRFTSIPAENGRTVLIR